MARTTSSSGTGLAPGRKPLAKQVAEDLRRRIVSSEFSPGARLPSEAELCDHYHVSRVTVRTAAKYLESQGLVDIRHGSGMFVVDFGGQVRTGLQELRSITETIEELGLNATVHRLSITRRHANPNERARLALTEGDDIVVIHREILADDAVVAVSIDVIPATFVPVSEDATLGNGSVFAVLDRIGLAPVRALAEIHAVHGKDVPTADARVADELSILLDQVHYDRDGHPVSYSKTYFVEGRFQFVILRTR